MSLIKLRKDFDAAMLTFIPNSFIFAYPVQTAKKIYNTTSILPFALMWKVVFYPKEKKKAV
jgi:hypothetical protein